MRDAEKQRAKKRAREEDGIGYLLGGNPSATSSLHGFTKNLMKYSRKCKITILSKEKI